MKKKLAFAFVLFVFVFHLFSLPPAPGQEGNYFPSQEYSSEIFGRHHGSREVELPQHILVLRADFTDQQFDLVPDYPDSLAHDQAFYERLLYHMSCYWNDASHGNYILTEDNFTVWDNVISLPQTMGYYGEDDSEGNQRIDLICEMVVDLIEAADNEIDFNNFDAIIIIHAGAGQETDTEMSDEIYTTFLSRRSLQSGLDPENDDFPGIETNDGIYLKEFSLIPETSNQPYVQINSGDTIYGLLGIICHNFGHQIGLPTLFDNDPDNGESYGIGGWGLMGTGVWNANSYVPPLPCAWSRYYLGWEDDNLVELDASAENLQITFPTAHDDSTPKLYKLKITDDEYFLLENRQENPDGSTYVNGNGETVVSFTFPTIENQQVYPPSSVNAGQPKFVFMENSYLGCEWDFYCPGYNLSSAPVDDGSGLLIWHIDENVINANFDPEFEMNQVNGDASHKGVDLEQASGIQTLDNKLYGYDSFYGSQDDAFRKEFVNEDSLNYYFGFNLHNDVTWLPTAASYYGGIPLEVDDIGVSDSLMTFKVNYGWYLDSGYEGEDKLSIIFSDFDSDGENELFCVTPEGKILLWKDDILADGFPVELNMAELNQPASYDEISNSILIPVQIQNSDFVKLYCLNSQISGYLEQLFLLNGFSWAGPVVIDPDESSEYRAFLPLNATDGTSEIIVLDTDYQEITSLTFETEMISNLILENNKLHFLGTDNVLFTEDLTSLSNETLALAIPAETEVLSFQMADIDNDQLGDFVITAADSLLYVFERNGNSFADFPVPIGLDALSLPSFADVNENGTLDILIGGENDFKVFTFSGQELMSSRKITNPDSLSSGAGIIAADVTGNDKPEIMGNFSRNRLCLWQNQNNNDFKMYTDFPHTFGKRSLTYPVLAEYSNLAAAFYIPSQNGVIFHADLPSAQMPQNHGSLYEYCDLQRTAFWQQTASVTPVSNKLFVKDETYFYPNPLSQVFSKGVDFGANVPEMTIILRMLTTKDANVNVKVFDIAGNKIYEKNQNCAKNVVGKMYINAGKLSTGVYFAILKADGEVLKLKFAVEK
ncbi:MAG TPA: hypothetical protein PLD62_04945 [Candidatus Cloacimonadota bacterium]|nr:hypothetical protein [Candidatus Cloacimonadota bacterium]